MNDIPVQRRRADGGAAAAVHPMPRLPRVSDCAVALNGHVLLSPGCVALMGLAAVRRATATVSVAADDVALHHPSAALQRRLDAPACRAAVAAILSSPPSAVPPADFAIAVLTAASAGPRVGLVGKRGLEAARSLPAGHVLGVYSGQLLLPREVDILPPAALAEHTRYAFNLRLPLAPSPGKRQRKAWRACVLGPAARVHNFVRLVNDCRVDASLPPPRGAQNAAFVTAVVAGVPLVVAVTTKAVRAGAPLLVDYGEDYWRLQS